MRFAIIVGLLMHAILLGALYVWVGLAADAMSACRQTYSYETCAHTLR